MLAYPVCGPVFQAPCVPDMAPVQTWPNVPADAPVPADGYQLVVRPSMASEANPPAGGAWWSGVLDRPDVARHVDGPPRRTVRCHCHLFLNLPRVQLFFISCYTPPLSVCASFSQADESCAAQAARRKRRRLSDTSTAQEDKNALMSEVRYDGLPSFQGGRDFAVAFSRRFGSPMFNEGDLRLSDTIVLRMPSHYQAKPYHASVGGARVTLVHLRLATNSLQI